MITFARRLNLLAAFFFVMASCHGYAADADTSRLFEQGNGLYEQGKYGEAAATYLQMLDKGTASSAVFFNLGNAWLKSGQIGRAIASFSAAGRLSPRDPDVQANLNYARNAVSGTGSIQSAPWQVILNRYSINEWSIIASGLYTAWALLMAARFAWPRYRDVLKGAAVGSGLAGLAALLCLGIVVADRFSNKIGIVVAKEIVVRYGPLDKSPEYYSLRNGAEVRVLDRYNGWIEIADRGGRRGWATPDALIVLPPLGLPEIKLAGR